MSASIYAADPFVGSRSGKRYLVYAIVSGQGMEARCLQDEEGMEQVEFVEADSLKIAIRTMHPPYEPCDATMDRLQDFSDIVSRLHRMGDILPFRFGTSLAVEDLADFLSPRRDNFLNILQRVAGCTEINIRWALPTGTLPTGACSNEEPQEFDPSVPGITGFEYMRRKRRIKLNEHYLESSALAVAECLQQWIGEGCVAINCNVQSMKAIRPEVEHACMYSVARVNLLVLRKTVIHAMNTASSAMLYSTKPTLVSGPWPPFSFIDRTEGHTHMVPRAVESTSFLEANA